MHFGPVIDIILEQIPEAPLGPGDPVSLASDITSLNLKTLFAHSKIKNKSFGNCVLSGLYLRLNNLTVSHDWSNEISSPDGSYWHGLMHRREPDVHNSNYWFRKVGSHPVFNVLLEKVQQFEGGETEINSLTGSGTWDPYKFNNLCDEARGSGSDLESLCIKIQNEEWYLLFEYCYVNSLGQNWQTP